MTLREQAEAIWNAGVAAVDSATLVRRAIQCDHSSITVAGERLDFASIGRIIVVGAGKAGAGMAAGIESSLGSELVASKVVGQCPFRLYSTFATDSFACCPSGGIE